MIEQQSDDVSTVELDLQAQAQVAEQVEEALAPAPEAVDGAGPLVGIIVGSASHLETMQEAGNVLREAEVAFEIEVLSAHRDPAGVAEYCQGARSRGLRAIIAGADGSAALPGIAAAHTDLPVIGVPLTGPLTAAGGLDALLSVVQTPPGVPVAAVGLDNPRNAAHLAVRILGA